MPNCYTALEELVYTFGGPWLFCLILLGLLVLLALVLSVARMKYVTADELPAAVPARRGSRLDHSFPFLESLNEVHFQSIPWATSVFVTEIRFLITRVECSVLYISLGVIIIWSCRFWKQIDTRNLRVMCIGCISWGQIHSVNLGIYLIPLQNK